MLRNVKTYEKPTTIDEAVSLVQTKSNAIYLAGGSWIVAQGDPTLEVLVDLQKVGLDEIAGDIEGVRIGAMVTLQALIDDSASAGVAVGVLARAASYIQSRNLREQGTLGGTLIVAGPADPLTTVLLVLDTSIYYADPVGHTAPFTSFVAYRERLVNACALITEVRVKRPPARSAAVLEVLGRSPRDKPIVCAAAYVEVDEGMTTEVRVAVGGVADRPVRLMKSEHLLERKLLDAEKVVQALEPTLEGLEVISDYRGSAEYRREMGKVLARRAIIAAWEKARRS